jgi:glycosyltransferase XagB
MQGSPKRADSRWSHDRAFLPDKEHADIGTRELPPELAFLTAEDISPELMEEGVGATRRAAVWSLERLLSEGKIIEEAYYRALAIHLGCEYYNGDPPLADSFDAVKGLRCGVGPLEPRSARPRIVVAPQAQLVPRLIEATRAGSIRSGSFALASPQRFANLIRAYRGSELLDVALDRLPASLTARKGMTGFQIAAVGVAAILVDRI